MYIMDKDLKLQDWEFSQRKYLPYEAKLMLSARRIQDWNDYYGGKVFVSFSGGLDSTVLVHMVEKVLEKKVPKVYVDTGLEFPQIREFVHGFDAEILYPEYSFRDVILKKGYPLVSKEVAAKVRKLRHGNLSDRYRNYLLHGDERGKLGKLPEIWKFLIDAPFDISEECCAITKERPLEKYAKQTGRVPFIGITQDEGMMRQRQYNRTGCNVYHAKQPKSQPLGFWTRQDILRYVTENRLRYSSAYGEIICQHGLYRTTGEQRTGCMFCAMGCHLEKTPNRYQRLRERDAKTYRYIMAPISAGGLGFDYVLNYCNFAH
ncbi:MAG: phosphoadenosine phosphosulfate reductase family protein [Lachnospiraceae bacterium]|jgi:3'-phosphoadenosine 5'-phosphosulfate sulfotransferase (PAPS reductase)/FAD synthetase|nr:phosphoadenosine phosphosulfate reductase family protein [Lachnospiraceae bacterium]